MAISKEFRELVEKGLGAAVILAGSGSDEAHVNVIFDEVRRYGLPVDVRVASAHKQPDVLYELIGEYEALNGPFMFIAVAGGVDALSGTLSFNTSRPVVSCPPEGSKKEVNMSCLGNPPGSSNVYVMRPDNAARFAAQMFSYVNPACRDALQKGIAKKRGELVTSDTELNGRYAGKQNGS